MKKKCSPKAKFGAYLDPNILKMLRQSGVILDPSNIQPIGDHQPGMPGSDVAAPLGEVSFSAPRGRGLTSAPMHTLNVPTPDNNLVPYSPQPLQSPTQKPAAGSKGTKKGPMIANAIGAAMGTLGDLAQGAFKSIPLLTALLPEEQQDPNPYVPYAYNPYPNGTGASVLYEDGGSIPGFHSVTRKVGNMVVIEEVPDGLPEMPMLAPAGSAKRNRFVPSMAPIDPPTPAKEPRSVTYEKLQLANKNVYSPQFHGEWNNRDMYQFFNAIPDNMDGVPVMKGDQWNGVDQVGGPGVPWNPYYVVPQQPQVVQQASPNYIPMMENGGSLQPGQEVELDEETIKKLMAQGYTFTF